MFVQNGDDDDGDEISTSCWNFLVHHCCSVVFALGDKQLNPNRDNFNDCRYIPYCYQQKEIIKS